MSVDGSQKEAESTPTSLSHVEHDWSAKITHNRDGSVVYEPFPDLLPDGSENPMARAMRHMRIILGRNYKNTDES